MVVAEVGDHRIDQLDVDLLDQDFVDRVQHLLQVRGDAVEREEADGELRGLLLRQRGGQPQAGGQQGQAEQKRDTFFVGSHKKSALL